MNIETYSTTDINLACALLSSKCELLRLEEVTEGKYAFVFEDTSFVRNAVDCYWKSIMKVTALEFAKNMRMLKNRLFQQM